MSQGKPLAGVRVLDLTQLLPGPMCTLHLADLGAEVIKIEPPEVGDPVRGGKGKYSTMFLMLNRNKRSVELDLRSESGQMMMHKLIASADVLVEGFRPGVTERLGISYSKAQELNKKLVYCSITGFGQEGPLVEAGGHDINYQALSGVLEQSGAAGGPPSQGNFPIADLAGGSMSAATGILAALFDAQRTGQGRHVDIAMTDCVMALNIMPAVSLQQAGQPVPRGHDYLSGALACYNIYATADDRHLSVGAIEMKFWRNFCDQIERPDLYDQGHLPGKAGAKAKAEVASIIATCSLDEWTRRFADADACTMPVLRVDEVIEHPHTQHREMVSYAKHPKAGDYFHFNCPIKMTGFEQDTASPAPELGADNTALRIELGLS